MKTIGLSPTQLNILLDIKPLTTLTPVKMHTIDTFSAAVTSISYILNTISCTIIETIKAKNVDTKASMKDIAFDWFI
jgi:hypothetical protein